MKRRSILSAPFVLAALAEPSRDWLLASLESLAGERGPRQVGLDQVAGIRDMFALFQEMDVMRGGGHARVALVEYMNSYVLPLARRDHRSERVQPGARCSASGPTTICPRSSSSPRTRATNSALAARRTDRCRRVSGAARSRSSRCQSSGDRP